MPDKPTCPYCNHNDIAPGVTHIMLGVKDGGCIDGVLDYIKVVAKKDESESGPCESDPS